MHCVGDAEEHKEEHEQFLARVNPFQDIDIDTYLRFMYMYSFLLFLYLLK